MSIFSKMIGKRKRLGQYPYLTFYLQSNFDAVADWTFCSSFRLQKDPNQPRGAGTTKSRLRRSISVPPPFLLRR